MMRSAAMGQGVRAGVLESGMRFLIALVALASSTTALAQMKAVGPPPVAVAPPAAVAADPQNLLVLDLSTGGRVTILMRPDIAPGHVERIRTLVRQKFYDGLIFHRVIDGFMAQGGDPTGTGQSGSKLPNLKPEFSELPHVRGTAAMARAGAEDSANSQFYIMLAPRFSLDNKYTVWGRVISGMEFVDAIEKGEPPANPSKIVQASIGADKLPPPPASVVAPVSAKPATGAPSTVTTTTTTQTAAPVAPPKGPAPARR